MQLNEVFSHTRHLDCSGSEMEKSHKSPTKKRLNSVVYIKINPKPVIKRYVEIV